MKKWYEDLILLISQWKDFRQLQPEGNLSQFAKWVLKDDDISSITTEQENFIIAKVEEMEEKNSIPDLANRGVIGHLVARMNLFVKNYAKIPFQETGLSNLEEFRLLQIIDRVQRINKSALSNESLMEFTTVVDMLKRFSKLGLIRQVTDPDDKRASLVQITAKGKNVLSKTYQVLASIQPNIAGDLSRKEQETLINLLLRLNHFHTDYFEEHYTRKKRKKE